MPLLSNRYFTQLNVNNWIVLIIIGIYSVLNFWGVEKNLPYIPEVDEQHKVERAMRMASTGDLNPGWFGHPGSTVIYPLTAVYYVRYLLLDGSLSSVSGSELSKVYDENPSELYLAGRLISIFYAILSIPFIYLVGRNAFNARVGLLGTWLFILYPLVIYHNQYIRTDSAAIFWGMLSLWLCIRIYNNPSIWNQLFAGFSIGLSIASRYFMVSLIPVLLIVNGKLFFESATSKKNFLLSMLVGLLAVCLGFTLSTPYFFLDSNTAIADLRNEAREFHLGADGLSRFGNFRWYLLFAFPRSITWPQWILTIAGILIIIYRKLFLQVLLLGFVIIYLIGISISGLHWQRWIIPILPMIAIFCSQAVIFGVEVLAKKLQFKPSTRNGLLIILVFILSAYPASQLIMMDLRHSNPSTRVIAREWIIANLPERSKIAQEWYTAPLNDTDYFVDEWFSLAYHAIDFDVYLQEGYDFLVVSDRIYKRFFNEPDRYRNEVKFYTDLFGKSQLLFTIEPSKTVGGPIIRVYKLVHTGG